MRHAERIAAGAALLAILAFPAENFAPSASAAEMTLPAAAEDGRYQPPAPRPPMGPVPHQRPARPLWNDGRPQTPPYWNGERPQRPPLAANPQPRPNKPLWSDGRPQIPHWNDGRPQRPVNRPPLYWDHQRPRQPEWQSPRPGDGYRPAPSLRRGFDDGRHHSGQRRFRHGNNPRHGE